MQTAYASYDTRSAFLAGASAAGTPVASTDGFVETASSPGIAAVLEPMGLLTLG